MICHLSLEVTFMNIILYYGKSDIKHLKTSDFDFSSKIIFVF